MSMALIASGTLIQISASGASSIGTPSTIPSSIKINAPNCKFELLDVTSHDSTGFFKEYIPGLSDGENCTDEMNYVPTNAIHTQIRTDSYARALDWFEIVFPAPSEGSGAGTGSHITFTAYIVGFPPIADVGQVLRVTMTAKVTGEPTWT